MRRLFINEQNFKYQKIRSAFRLIIKKGIVILITHLVDEFLLYATMHKL